MRGRACASRWSFPRTRRWSDARQSLPGHHTTPAGNADVTARAARRRGRFARVVTATATARLPRQRPRPHHYCRLHLRQPARPFAFPRPVRACRPRRKTCRPRTGRAILVCKEGSRSSCTRAPPLLPYCGQPSRLRSSSSRQSGPLSFLLAPPPPSEATPRPHVRIRTNHQQLIMAAAHACPHTTAAGRVEVLVASPPLLGPPCPRVRTTRRGRGAKVDAGAGGPAA